MSYISTHFASPNYLPPLNWDLNPIFFQPCSSSQKRKKYKKNKQKASFSRISHHKIHSSLFSLIFQPMLDFLFSRNYFVTSLYQAPPYYSFVKIFPFGKALLFFQQTKLSPQKTSSTYIAQKFSRSWIKHRMHFYTKNSQIVLLVNHNPLNNS